MGSAAAVGDGAAHTPLLALGSQFGFEEVFLKDESGGVGGTFKGRLARTALQLHPPGTTFGAISYGNTALSFALALKEHVSHGSVSRFVSFVPDGIENWTFGPDTAAQEVRGEDLIALLRGIVDVVPLNLSARTYDDEALRCIAREAGVPVERFVNVTEGVSVPAYVPIIIEAIEQIGDIPDVVIVQFGAGVLCNEILDHVAKLGRGRVIAISTPDPRSIAQMLYGPLWLDIDALASTGIGWSRHVSPDKTGAPRQPYPVYEVTGRMLLEGLRLAQAFGVSAEPSGAAGLGYLALASEYVKQHAPGARNVLVINTGNGVDAVCKHAVAL